MWCINSLSLSIRKRLMGGLDPKAACGRCQLTCESKPESRRRAAPTSRRAERRPAPAKAVWMKLGGAVGLGRAGLGPDMPDPGALHATANALDVQHGPLPAVTDPEAPVAVRGRPQGTRRRSPASRWGTGRRRRCARRCRRGRARSRSAPWRRLARMPVTWRPDLSKRPGLLTPLRVMSPGRSCGQWRAGSSGSRSLSRDRPARLSIRLTVAVETPVATAMRAPTGRCTARRRSLRRHAPAWTCVAGGAKRLGAPGPLGHRLGHDAERLGRLGPAHLPGEHAPRHPFPAQRRRSGVLAHLHAVSPKRQ